MSAPLFFLAATWIFLPWPSVGFGLPKLLLFAVSAGLFALNKGSREDQIDPIQFVKTPLGCLLALYGLLIILSPLWSVAPLQSLLGAAPRFEGVLTHCLYLAWAWLGINMGYSPNGREKATQIIVAANAGVVVYGALQKLGLDPFAAWFNHSTLLGRTASTLGMPTALALFIVITWPFVLQRARQTQRKIFIGLFLLNLLVLLATVTRSAVLALGVAMAISLFWQPQASLTLTTRHKYFMVAASLLLVTCGLIFSWQRFSVAGEASRSVTARLLMWQASVPLVAKYPLGAGLATTGLLSARYLDPAILKYEGAAASIDRLHNQLIDLTVTLGPLSALVFYALLIGLLVTLYRRRHSPLNNFYLTVFISLLAGSLTLMFNFHTLVTAVYFWLVLGLALGALKSQKQPSYHCVNTLIQGLIIVLASLISVITMAWLAARYTMDQAEQIYRRGHLTQAAAAYQISLNKFAYDRTILIRSLDTNLQRLEKNRDPLVRAQVTSQLTQLEQLTGGEDGMPLLLRAWLSAIENQPDATEWLLLQASFKQVGGQANRIIAQRCQKLLSQSYHFAM